MNTRNINGPLSDGLAVAKFNSAEAVALLPAEADLDSVGSGLIAWLDRSAAKVFPAIGVRTSTDKGDRYVGYQPFH